VMECFDGESLSLFEKTVGFDLREGIPHEEAQRVAKFLSDNLVRISET
jgi:hypothetical protein